MPTQLERLRESVDDSAQATLSRSAQDRGHRSLLQRVVDVLEKQDQEIDRLREQLERERIERQEKIANLDTAIVSCGQSLDDVQGRVDDIGRQL